DGDDRAGRSAARRGRRLDPRRVRHLAHLPGLAHTALHTAPGPPGQARCGCGGLEHGHLDHRRVGPGAGRPDPLHARLDVLHAGSPDGVPGQRAHQRAGRCRPDQPGGLMAIPEETFAELAEYYDETYTAAADMFKVVEASITYVNSAGSAADPALREAVASYVDKNGETLPFSSYAR